MDTKEEQKIIEETRRVFASLALIAPFAYPMLAMPIRLDPRLPAPAATNGVTVIINPKEWEKKTFKQKMFIAIHEWMHIALLHCKKLGKKRRVMHNYCCDFNINSMIRIDMKDQFEMPCCLFDPTYHNKSSEEIYKDLNNEVKRRQEEGMTPFCHCCNREFVKGDYADGRWKDPDVVKCPVCKRPTADGKEIPEPEYVDRENAINQLMVEEFGAPWGNDLQDLPVDADEQKIIDQVMKAAARCRSQGKMPGSMPSFYEEYIETIKKSNVPWYRILYRYAKESLKGNTDRNPFKPDPKYLPFDIFIPTERGRRVSKLVLIVDTSGSMETEEFKYAAGHIEKFCTLVDNLTVITADTIVQEVLRVRNVRRELKKHALKFKGRGGTRMDEAFEAANKLRPSLIILYSDMYIGDFPPKPRAPVIFLATKDANITKVPYGILLNMESQGQY